MVTQYLDFIIQDLFPRILLLLDSLLIAEGVTWLGFVVAVTLLCLIIGSILMRVT